MPAISVLTVDTTPVASGRVVALEAGGTVTYPVGDIARAFGIILSSAAPTVTENAAAGYVTGMRWIQAGGSIYESRDASTGLWIDTASGGAGAKNNTTASRDPLATDDASDGYSVTSVWIHGSKAWMCGDATLGAAVWIPLTPSGGISAQPLLQGARSKVLNITSSISAGVVTLDTDYDDFYLPSLTSDLTIVLPSATGGERWTPQIDIHQDNAGGHAVTIKDGGFNAVTELSSSLVPNTDPGSMNLYAFFYSFALAQWTYAIVNQLAEAAVNTEYTIAGQTIGAAPANLTNLWRADAWTIQEDVSFGVSDVRRVYISEQPGGDELHAAKFTGGGDTITDAEVLALTRTGSSTSSYNQTIYLRGQGTEGGGGKQAYAASLSSGTVFAVLLTTSNILTPLASASFSWSVDTEYWIRFRVTGTALKAKVWAYGTSEPGAWTIETTDATINAGWIGIGSYQDAGPHRYAYVAWTTDGSTVPIP